MSGSTTITIASTMLGPMLCTSTPAPGQDPDYSVILAGANDANALNGGIGITYNVDGDAFAEWIERFPDLAAFISIVSDNELAAMQEFAGLYGFQAGLPATPPGPPTVIEAPYVEKVGSHGQHIDLVCSQGDWSNQPTGYAYQWQIDGVNVGTNVPAYTTAPADMGKTATCVVTASNGEGSTNATSNGVLVQP